MNALRTWLRNGTTQDKKALARTSRISSAMLDQYSGGHRKMSATAARRIELATVKLRDTRATEVLRRERLCSACGKCELAKQARG